MSKSKATNLKPQGLQKDNKLVDPKLGDLSTKNNTSLDMKNLLSHLHHPGSTKEYQGDDDPDAIQVSEYWGSSTVHIQSPKISFEFFPPRSDSAKKSLKETQQKLSSINPDYFSVTFGAFGSSQNTTFETVSNLSKITDIPVTPHITCTGTSKKQVTELMDKYTEHGVNQVMVLKGDIPNSATEKGDFNYANEMVQFIKENYANIDIIVAAYPEKHPHANCVGKDINFFVDKVNAGATEAVTQYFYNIDAYFHFVEELQKRNVDIPITPGIMPITNFERIINFSKTCGAEIPAWILNGLKLYKNDSESLRSFGHDVVNDMCQKLKKNGVNSFHFFSMNESEPVLTLSKNLI